MNVQFLLCCKKFLANRAVEFTNFFVNHINMQFQSIRISELFLAFVTSKCADFFMNRLNVSLEVVAMPVNLFTAMWAFLIVFRLIL